MCVYIYIYIFMFITYVYLPRNGVIALWPKTSVVICKYYVSQKQNGLNDKIHWYSILLTVII